MDGKLAALFGYQSSSAGCQAGSRSQQQRHSAADWGDGMSASCTAGQLFPNAAAGNGCPHNDLWYHWLMSISCHNNNSDNISALIDGI